MSTYTCTYKIKLHLVEQFNSNIFLYCVLRLCTLVIIPPIVWNGPVHWPISQRMCVLCTQGQIPTLHTLHRGNGICCTKPRQSCSYVYRNLLNIRNVPTNPQLASPSQRLMSRRLQTTIPTSTPLLKPTVYTRVTAQLRKRLQQQKFSFDKSAKPLRPLNPGQVVRLQSPKGNDQLGIVKSIPVTPDPISSMLKASYFFTLIAVFSPVCHRYFVKLIISDSCSVNPSDSKSADSSLQT